VPLISLAAAAVCSFATTYVLIRVLLPVLQRRGIMDVPNKRSSHLLPTPRGAGFGVVPGIAAGIAAAALTGAGAVHWVILAGAAAVAVCGAADDLLRGIPAGIRLLVHVSAASLVVIVRGGLPALPLPNDIPFDSQAVGVFVSVLWIVSVTNIFNFLDGIDGFAGAQALVAGVALALIMPGSAAMAAAIALAAAAAGFLLYNWHPARIFLGDAGSTTIGFLIAALPFHAPDHRRPDLVFCAVLFTWFFLADGVFTMLRRTLRLEPIWKPHRSHLYQKLSKAGIAHDVIVTRVMAPAILLSALTVITFRSSDPELLWLPLIGAVALFVAYFVWAEKNHDYGNITSQRNAVSGK
jgi:UDP-N-acetylmuramyl pentapeptide phosphotransferase/UDP-N-acetylglucosamine-1-phosphate transferase